MSGPSFCTFVLIAASCYALSSSSNTVQHEQATHKLDLANRINEADSVASNVRERLQQNSHMASLQTRQKREYKELNDIIDELEESNNGANGIGAGSSSYAQKAQTASAQMPQDYDLDNMPALTYYLLLQKLRQLQSAEPTYRVRTPRLGRSIDFQQMFDNSDDGHRSQQQQQQQQQQLQQFSPQQQQFNEEQLEENYGGFGGMPRHFVARLIKKSVPFKPRLGKRAQVCGNSKNAGGVAD